MDEGDTAGRVAVSSHFTPSIDEADDNAADDENAVYFEDVHTSLLQVRSRDLPAPGSMGADLQRCIFDRGTAVEYYTHCGRKAHAGIEPTGG
jgi:hypothetical protein